MKALHTFALLCYGQGNRVILTNRVIQHRIQYLSKMAHKTQQHSLKVDSCRVFYLLLTVVPSGHIQMSTCIILLN